MDSITQPLFERLTELKAKREGLLTQREAIDNQLQDVDRIIAAVQVTIRYETERKSTPRPHSNNGAAHISKWTGVALTDAIRQLLAEFTEEQKRDRVHLFRQVWKRLESEGFDFGGRRASSSVNITLSKLLKQEEEEVAKKAQESK